MTLPIEKTETPVLILRSVHHGGLAIARSLGRLGVPVYVLDSNSHAPSFSSRYCRGKFVWDIDLAPAHDTVDFLVGIARKLRRRPILIPTTDHGALLVADHGNALRPWFLFPDLPGPLAQSLYRKKDMHFVARTAGIPTPEAFFPQSKQDLLNFADSARFPIMVKAIDDRSTRRRGLRTKVIARNKQELIEVYDTIEDPRAPNLMLQEYIPGGEDGNWMFNGYFDENSTCLFGLTGKKIRQFPTYTGPTSLGVCLPNPVVDQMTRDFMKTISYRGILDIGYRWDARDGLYKVLDVNPRIGSTFRLFVSDTGMDVARALYFNMTGQPLPAPGGAVLGRKWMVEDFDMLASFGYWRDRKLAAADWIRSFRGLQESAFFCRDDPRPILTACINDVRELFRLFRRLELAPQHATRRRSETLLRRVAKG
ncbi:MAG: hypothetical protein DMG59_04365 [Acidobacteria bacterium]|nr:MAG: hypothetical protein DMG59_04365 [Acidobacteriota bacterium]